MEVTLMKNDEDVFAFVHSELALILDDDPARLTRDYHLLNFKIDALDVFELTLRIEEFTGAYVDEHPIQDIFDQEGKTVGDLCDLIMGFVKGYKGYENHTAVVVNGGE
jgi:acyl carrier protein